MVREEMVCESVVDIRRVEDVTRLEKEVVVRSDGEVERRDAAGIGEFKERGTPGSSRWWWV